MPWRGPSRTIPSELLKAAVCIAEVGSQSKAAQVLNISQPAVSSQLKRLESIVGGVIFKRTAFGTAPTEMGLLVLKEARLIMDAQAQLVRISGGTDGPDPALRMGLGNIFTDRLHRISSLDLKTMYIKTASSTEITQEFSDGALHFACVLENPAVTHDLDQYLIAETSEQLVWVKSRDFVLSPGKPIPLIVWPGELWMTKSLMAAGSAYRIAFTSSDLHSRLWAAKASMGVTCYPSSFVPPELKIAEDHYLPKLGAARLLLFSRSVYGGNPKPMIDKVVSLLRDDGDGLH